MGSEDWADILSIVTGIVIILGAVVGGLWTTWIYRRERRAFPRANLSQKVQAIKLTDDKFFVTWASYDQDGDKYGIYGQIFYVDGTRYYSEFQLNTYTIGHQGFKYGPSATNLEDKKFVVAWDSENQDGSDYGVFGRIFAIDEVPYITTNNFTITEDQALPITTNMLNTTDIEDASDVLTSNDKYRVGAIAHGIPENPGDNYCRFEITESLMNEKMTFRAWEKPKYFGTQHVCHIFFGTCRSRY